MGRTGKKFGYEHYQITPDIIALGKALGNGYPVSAVVTRSDLEAQLASYELYYAQSHQLDPLGTSIALKVIEVFEEENIIEKLQPKIEKIHSFLKSLSHSFIKEIRSYGFIFAIEFNKLGTDYLGKDRVWELIARMIEDLLEEGVMIGYNVNKNQVRFLPPLTISDDEIEFLIKAMVKVFDEIKKNESN